jgi:hypothetical protein
MACGLNRRSAKSPWSEGSSSVFERTTEASSAICSFSLVKYPNCSLLAAKNKIIEPPPSIVLLPALKVRFK